MGLFALLPVVARIVNGGEVAAVGHGIEGHGVQIETTTSWPAVVNA